MLLCYNPCECKCFYVITGRNIHVLCISMSFYAIEMPVQWRLDISNQLVRGLQKVLFKAHVAFRDIDLKCL